ncbi:MAG: acyl-[acyl-carrier-protein]--UDP-N-acetylglucosamine O-acyltransferase, partial [Acidobacteriota bacterium]
MARTIHPSTVIHPAAELAGDLEIGPFCTIGPGVRLGSGCHLESHVVLTGETTIGENNRFFPFSVVGGIPQDLKFSGERSRLEIGSDNTFRESMTV